MFGRSKDPFDESFDKFVEDQFKVSERLHRDAELAQKKADARAAAMQAQQQYGGLLGGGQYANQLGQQSSQQSQLAAMAQAMAMAGRGGLVGAVPPPPYIPKKSAQEELNEVAEMIGLKPENDGFVTLAMVLREVIRLTGIQKPIKKEEDLISALMEAKE